MRLSLPESKTCAVICDNYAKEHTNEEGGKYIFSQHCSYFLWKWFPTPATWSILTQGSITQGQYWQVKRNKIAVHRGNNGGC